MQVFYNLFVFVTIYLCVTIKNIYNIIMKEVFVIGIDNIQIGKRLYIERKRREMSMKEVASLVNLHESSVQRYEAGLVKKISIDKLKEFAKVLNLDIDYLIGAGKNDIVTSTSEDIHSFAVELIKGIQANEKKSILDDDGNVPQYLIDLIISAIKMDEQQKKITNP